MKKFYFTLTALFFTSVSFTNLFAADIVTSLTLFDLTQERMNNTYTDSEGNTIKFSTHQPDATSFRYLSDLDNPLECAGEAVPSQSPINALYTKIVLKGSTGSGLALSPSFLIELGDNSTVTEIKLMGVGGAATGGAELMYALSTTGSDYGDFYVPDYPLYFTNNKCNYNDGQNTDIQVPSGTKYILGIATDADLDGMQMSVTSPFVIHAFRFLAEKNTPVGIEDQENDKENKLITQIDNEILLSSPSDVLVYHITGKQIENARNIESLDLNKFSKGIYIIKAQSVDKTRSEVRKVIVR